MSGKLGCDVGPHRRIGISPPQWHRGPGLASSAGVPWDLGKENAPSNGGTDLYACMSVCMYVCMYVG